MNYTHSLARVALLTVAAAAIFGAAAQAQVKSLPNVKPSVRPELRKLDLKPDLAIRKFRLKTYGKCKPRQAVLTFEVVVANIGNAPASLSGGAIVKVAEKNGAGPWAGGAPLKHPIPPGGKVRLSVPVYYLQSDPGHMVSGAPHRFRAEADPLKRIAEKNENNNHSAIVVVKAPPKCQNANKSHIAQSDRPLIGKDRDPRRLPGAPDRFALTRPDLVAGATVAAQNCEIGKVGLRIFNIGNGGVPESAWDAAGGSTIAIHLDGRPWGTVKLRDADPEKLLRRPRSRSRGHEISLPVRRLQVGSHRVAVTVDSNNTVAELNEDNNARAVAVYCRVEADPDAFSSGQ